jgi:hypothetical protein
MALTFCWRRRQQFKDLGVRQMYISSMPLNTQIIIICGVAAAFVATLFYILWSGKPSKGNKSKEDRAKEMKQAFRSIERQNLLSGRDNRTDSIKVCPRFLLR